MADLVVALDYPGAGPALELVDRLGDRVPCYKVGLELFTSAGPAVVRELKARGRAVFLDLKLHDIPNTVAGAARSAAGLGVDLLTVHALGGTRMVESARKAVEGSPVRLLAVTVLTSTTAAEWGAVTGQAGADTSHEAARLAELAVEAGAHGVVSSAGEVGTIRARIGAGPLVVVPGVRLPGEPTDDQRRVFTPAEAVRAGADLLVVGRSVIRAQDPAEAVARLREAMAMELSEA